MTTKPTRVPTVFGPETWFPVQPVLPGPFREWREAEFERVKSRLVGERLTGSEDLESNVNVRRAANEAAALAWATPYPLLLFPVLFEEAADSALARLQRQRQIRVRSRELLPS
jgi:hypothetical protein